MYKIHAQSYKTSMPIYVEGIYLMKVVFLKIEIEAFKAKILLIKIVNMLYFNSCFVCYSKIGNRNEWLKILLITVLREPLLLRVNSLTSNWETS